MDEANLSESLFGSGGRTPSDPSQARRPGEVPASDPVREQLPAPPPPVSRRQARERQEFTHQFADEQHDDFAGDHDEYVDPEHPDRAKVRARRGCLALVVVLVVLLAGGAFAVKNLGGGLFGGGSSAADSNDYTGSGTGSVQIVVDKGDSGSDIGRTLQQAGVVKSASTFAAVAGATPGFSAIQPGTYTMRKQMSSSAAAALMLAPGTRQAGIVIRENLWNKEIFALLSKATGVPVADYEKVTGAQVGLPAGAKGNLTGWLFPSTYTFSKGATAAAQLKEMVDLTKSKLTSLGIDPDGAERTLILASLVQGEADPQTYGPKVARVIDNRLTPAVDKGQTNGILGLDSAVSFGVQHRATMPSAADLKNDNPYNLRLHPGLPPGPIGNPGVAAIKAAQHPATGDWLYFVTVDLDTGETLFSTTYQQFQADSAKLTAWCSAHKGRC